MKEISKSTHIYFLGIAGTGMAAAAGLLHQAGYKVSGSENNMYPPMSDLLIKMKIPTYTPYSAENILKAQPDLVVVGNSMSIGHTELEAVIKSQIPYTSFPALIENIFLSSPESINIVISGTHGKSTTSAWLTAILRELGEDPSYLIGAVPKGEEAGFNKGGGRFFVLEGDEYDTAFFDKKSKFFHYRPNYLVINNIEFDHADIFANLTEIQDAFAELCSLVKQKTHIITNNSSQPLNEMLSKHRLNNATTPFGNIKESHPQGASVAHTSSQFKNDSNTWIHHYQHQSLAFCVRSPLGGNHNGANLAGIFSLLFKLSENGLLKETKIDSWIQAAEKFPGIKRRSDFLGQIANIMVFQDFAHHPSAVETMIQTFRTTHPKYRLFCGFDPKNATSRRNIFCESYAKAFQAADFTLIAPCPSDSRIPVNERMDTNALARQIGPHAAAFASIPEMKKFAVSNLRPGDLLVLFSPGSFSGLGESLMDALRSRYQQRDTSSKTALL